ncbi:MAG: PilZ domain-containing protein [Vulcanimicrobiota bacterium]
MAENQGSDLPGRLRQAASSFEGAVDPNLPPLAQRSQEASGLQEMVNYAADRLALLRLQNLRESLADVENILRSLKDELEVRRQEGRSVKLTEQLVWEAEQERARLLGQISAAVEVPGIYRERRRRYESEESFERITDPRTRITQNFARFRRPSEEEFTREDHQPVRERARLYRDEDYEDDRPYFYTRSQEGPSFELSSGGRNLRESKSPSRETPSWMSVRVERKTRTPQPPSELRLDGEGLSGRGFRRDRPKPQPLQLDRSAEARRTASPRPKPTAGLAWLERAAEKPTARPRILEPLDVTAEDLPAIPEDDELLLEDDRFLDLELEDEDLGELEVADLELDELEDFDLADLELDENELLALEDLDLGLDLDEAEADMVDEELAEPFLDDLDLELEDDLELVPAVEEAVDDLSQDYDELLAMVEEPQPELAEGEELDLGELDDLEDDYGLEAIDFEDDDESLDELGSLAEIDLDNLDFDALDLDELEADAAEMTEDVIVPEVTLEEPIELAPPAEVEEPMVEEPIELAPPAEVEEPMVEEAIELAPPAEVEEPMVEEAIELVPPAEVEEPIVEEAIELAPLAEVEEPIVEEAIELAPPAELEEPIVEEAIELAPLAEVEEPSVEEAIELAPPAEVEEPIVEEAIELAPPAEVEEPMVEEAIELAPPAEVEEPIVEEAIELAPPAEVEEPIVEEAIELAPPAEVEEPIVEEAIELAPPAEVEEPIVEEAIELAPPAEVEEPMVEEASELAPPAEVEEPIVEEAIELAPPAEVEEPIVEEAIELAPPAEVEEPLELSGPVELSGPADLFEGPDVVVTEPVVVAPAVTEVVAEEDLFAGPSSAEPLQSDDLFASSEPVALVSEGPASLDDGLLGGSGESLDGGDFFGGPATGPTSWLDETPIGAPSAELQSPVSEAEASPVAGTSLEDLIEGVAAEEAVAPPPPAAVEAPAPPQESGASAQERRRLVRLACDFDTSAYLEGRPVTVKLVDISLGGGKLRGPQSSFQRGQLIQVSNPLPEARVNEPVTARIVWMRPSRDEDGKYDIGLQFEESPEVLGKSWVITVLNKIGMQSKVFNQRKYTRAVANLPIEIDLKTKERTPGTALDIGLGGALLAVNRPLSPTTRFTLHMGPLGNHDKLELNCEVISSRHDEAGVGWTHSAKFAEISTTQTKLLGKYVVDLLKAGGSV